MSNDEQTKKTASFVKDVRQNLIDELIAVSDKWNVGEDGTNFEKMQEERRAVLNKYEERAESAEQILGQLAITMKAVHEFTEAAPYKLNDLLVSKDSWPFEDLSQVDEHFGPLPEGYCYRNLVSHSFGISQAEANSANNLIRLPSEISSLMDADMNLAGDGIPDHDLLAWLASQSGALNRLWNLRELAHLGIIESSDLPAVGIQKGAGPGGKAAASEPAGDLEMNQEIKKWVDDFVDFCLLHYNGQEENSDVEILGGVGAKRDAFKRLREIPNGCAALRSLLDHAEIAVRVSAAIYLLASEPQSALPVLQKVAATWSGDETKKHGRPACLNAQRALWMHQDGKLSYDAF
jgi:hypothetical protein